MIELTERRLIGNGGTCQTDDRLRNDVHCEVAGGQDDGRDGGA